MSFTFPKSHRLSGPREFDAVYSVKVRDSRGPLLIYARPNNLTHARLGLSVSRKVGNAVRRNRVKRLLREAFRLHRHEWPSGCDWVVVVRPHGGGSVQDYAAVLSDLTKRLDGRWKKIKADDNLSNKTSDEVKEPPFLHEPANGGEKRAVADEQKFLVDQTRPPDEACDNDNAASAAVETHSVPHHRAPGLPRATIPARGLMFLVVAYRVTLGRFLGGQCRFYPTCSQYALDALRKDGAWAGGLKTLRRLARCRPGGPSGFDPV